MCDESANKMQPVHRGFSARTVYTCDLCGVETPSQKQMVEHIETHENKEYCSVAAEDTAFQEDISSSQFELCSTTNSVLSNARKLENLSSLVHDSNDTPLASDTTLAVVLTDVSDDDACDVFNVLVQQVINDGSELSTDHDESQKFMVIGNGNQITAGVQDHDMVCLPADDGQYACAECVRRFSSVRGLRIHMSVHRKKVNSSLKSEKTSEIPVPVLLLESAQDSNHIPFLCMMCEEQCSSDHTLAVHVQSKHRNNNPFITICCGQLYDVSDAHTKHFKENHKPGKTCMKCGIRGHTQLHRGDCAEERLCNFCSAGQLIVKPSEIERETAQFGTEVDAVNFAAEIGSATLLAIDDAQSGSRQFVCSFRGCGRKFNWKSNLRRHIQTHYPENANSEHDQHGSGHSLEGLGNSHCTAAKPKAKQFSCSICGQLFMWRHNLQRHMRNGHADRSKDETVPLPAVVKQELFEQDGNSAGQDDLPLVGCILSNLGDQRSMFDVSDFSEARPSKNNKCVCNRCGEQFFWESNLRRHLKHANCSEGLDVEALGKSRNQACGKCGRRFAQLYHLRVHMAAHANAERIGTSKRFLCSDCGRGFGDARQLRIHMLRHAGIKPHQCNTCGKAFTVVALLNEHIATKHEGHRFVCEQCGHEANSRSALYTHVRYVHAAPGSVRPFTCKVCNRGFWSSAALKRHESAHADAGSTKRKAMCSICGLLFRHVYNLGHHISTLHGLEAKGSSLSATPFACGSCGELFENGDGFKTHYRSKHRNR